MKKLVKPILFSTCLLASYSLGATINSMALEDKHEKEVEEAIIDTKIKDYDLYSDGKPQDIAFYANLFYDDVNKKDEKRLALLLSTVLDIPEKEIHEKMNTTDEHGHPVPYVKIAEHVSDKKVQELKTLLNGDKTLGESSCLGFNLSD